MIEIGDYGRELDGTVHQDVFRPTSGASSSQETDPLALMSDNYSNSNGLSFLLLVRTAVCLNSFLFSISVRCRI